MKITTRAIVAALSAGLLLFTATVVSAEETEDEFDATIDILDNISIEQTDLIDFGTLGAPTTEPVDLTLDLTDGVDLEGDDDAYHAEDANSGEATVTGDPDEGVWVRVEGIDDFGDEVTLNYLDFDGTEFSEVGDDVELFPEDGQEAFPIGGQVEVTEDVEAGTFTATVDLSANHE